MRHVKLDHDVNGTVNTLERVDVKPAFPGINVMHVEKSFITSEDHGKIDWAPNAASMFVVVQGRYRIAPGVGSPAHITMPNSTISKNYFYVTKRKDNEP